MIRILLVEDQYFARLAMHTIFDARQDMQIVAESGLGSRALALYEQHKPDVVIMDLRLPGLSGWDAIRQIRGVDSNARVLVLSNYEGSEDVHRALEAGAIGYLSKDASADELIAGVEAAHKGRRYVSKALERLLKKRIEDDELTSRELEVLEALAKGMSNRQAAEHLGIAEKTVRIHVSHILDKLGATDRTQAVIAAFQRGIVHLE